MHLILGTLIQCVIFFKESVQLYVCYTEHIIRITLSFVEVIYNVWEQLGGMKGKSGQDWNSRSNTKVRRGPKRTKDRIITPCWKNNSDADWVFPQPSACHPLRPVSSVRHCRGERRISALWSSLIPPSLSTSLYQPQKCDALQCCILRRLLPAVYPSARQEHAGRSCDIIQPRQEVRLPKDAQLQLRE